MGHHKRGRPKHQRAGCLWCKFHKDERRLKVPKPSVQRQVDSFVAMDASSVEAEKRAVAALERDAEEGVYADD